jgi:molybdopterin converting factor small subunit
LVVAVYDHLVQVPETAGILGGDDGPDPTHLEERRRFLTLWLTRSLGLNTSDEFAVFLFRAGLAHGGLGPRQVRVPSGYATSSIGIVLANCSRYLADKELPSEISANAMGAWSRYLCAQLGILRLGCVAATELQEGPHHIRCATYGRLRSVLGRRDVAVGVKSDDRIGDVLRKFFNVYPEVRAEVLDRVWDESDAGHCSKITLIPTYSPIRGWRILLNGRDIRYSGGMDIPVAPGDEVELFPPGR